MPHRERLQRATRALKQQDLDALLMTPGASMSYLTGFEHGHAAERLLALVLKRDGSADWIVPEMNVPQLEARLLPGQAVHAWSDAQSYLPALNECVAGARSVAFDDEARAAFLLDLRAVSPQVRVEKASVIMRGLRMRKDAAELAALRYAASIVDQTIPTAISLCKAGVRESDVEQALRAALLACAPEASVAFTIVASGPNGALPHHETAQRLLQHGDVVILDFGMREPGGYHSDITVTCAIGEPADPEARRVYQVVYDAQQAAINAVKPGARCGDIDRAARAVIEKAGYGAQFLHRTGHGLGLQVHEPPYLVGGSEEVLEEGMTFSIEPGIYLPGRFGVRLEIITSVAADGVSLINAPSARELPIA